MIQVYYTRLPQQLQVPDYYKYLSLLPAELQQKSIRFWQWRDRWLNLLGKLLLVRALEPLGFTASCLQALQYGLNGRPSISPQVDFNISHSGDYVLCAVGSGLRLGVDIEEIKQVDLSDFENVMSKDQWTQIFNSEDVYRTFFSYWTIKESVIKADSRGLSVPLDGIHVFDNEAFCGSDTWHLTDLGIHRNYCSCIATNKKNIKIELHYTDFLLNSPH